MRMVMSERMWSIIGRSSVLGSKTLNQDLLAGMMKETLLEMMFLQGVEKWVVVVTHDESTFHVNDG